jgi:phosphatidylglycerol lysyltransferase
MRKWIPRLLIIAFLWIVVARLAEIKKLGGILAGGRWQWIGAALLLQFIYYALYTGLYKSAFAAVGVKSRWRDLLPVTLGSLFVNVVAPAGGMTGAALFVDDAARRGESGAKAAAGTLLVTITELGAFEALLLPGMAYLYTHHDLKTYEVAGAAALTALVSVLSLALILGLWRPMWIERLLGMLQRVSARAAGFFHRESPLDEQWAAQTAAEFSSAAEALRRAPVEVARTVLIALVCHLIDLVCLYTVFLAFHQSVGFGGLIAGYSMAILFWIVSPTPQGVGVVEAVIALVYTSLGVPPTKALVIALAYRGVTFWLPMLIGVVALQRARSFRVEQRTRAKLAEVRAAAIMVGLMGVVSVLSAITPSLPQRLELLDPLLTSAVRHGARLAAALTGFFLILISNGLRRHKHVAWAIAILLLLASVASHLIKGLDYEEASIALAMVLWLWTLRTQFRSMSDQPSVKQGIIVFAGAALFTLLYGTVGFYLLDRHFSVNFSLSAAVNQTLTMFFALYSPGLEPVTGFGRYFASSIYVVGAITIGYSLILLLRPVFLRQLATPQEHARAQEIVERYGRSSLAAVALLPDKSYFFSKGGSVIAFVATAGIGLALGDPIGPESDAADAIREFQEHCTRHDWIPAFYQTLPDYLDHYKAAGLSTLCIGHEGIVDLNAFTLEGSAVKQLRTSMSKLHKLGYEAVVYDPPIDDLSLEELRLVSNEWLATMRGAEKRFSLGWFDDDYIRACKVMVARSAVDDDIAAFANLVPEYQLNECTIDLMRRSKDAPSGTMDFMFVSLFQWAKSAGFDTFNLGLSPLAGVGVSSEDPVSERALRFIYKHVNQFYSFTGLHDFKEKFGPSWSPRYLVYSGATTLAATAYAIVRADAGTGLIESYLVKRFR